MPEYRELAGMIGGGIFFAAFVPYFIDILRGRTKPQRATWIIWTILGVLILLSYKSVGAQNTIWVAIAGALCPAVILVLSIWRGVGGSSKLDIAGLVGAAIGITAWWLTTSPFVGLVMFMLTDQVASVPTMVKLWHEPESESLPAWLLWLLSSIFQLFALEGWDLQVSIYPLSYLVGQIVIVALILRKYRRRTAP
jgi:hypothetical protein